MAEGGLRAFVIAMHREHGVLLLQAEKRKKGVHFQLPGGRIDKQEVDQYDSCLEGAQRAAAARELFEETGIDLRGENSSRRLIQLDFPESMLSSIGNRRCFFFLDLCDEDAPSADHDSERPITGEDFKLKISKEHTGFMFERNIERAAAAVKKHSGGKCSKALYAFAAMGDAC
eukprot:g5361.t1